MRGGRVRPGRVGAAPPVAEEAVQRKLATSQVSRPPRRPFVTLVLAGLMALATAAALAPDVGEGSASPAALDAARTFLEQNAGVEVSERNRELLGPAFVDVVEAAHARQEDAGTGAIFSSRMQERTQRKFEALADEAFELRMREFPAWRFGVTGPTTETVNHFSHAFVHSSLLALAVSLVFFVLAGISLEIAWTAPVFGAFCLLAATLPSVVFRLFDFAGGAPLSGASGLVSAVLGAYWVRGFGGRLPLPGFALIPAWAFAEFYLARGIRVENVDAAPLFTLASGLVFGAGAAVFLQLVGLERRLARQMDLDGDSDHSPAQHEAERSQLPSADPPQPAAHETTCYPVESDVDLDSPALPVASEVVDPNALPVASIERELDEGAAGLADDPTAPGGPPEAWNDPGLRHGLAADTDAGESPSLLDGDGLPDGYPDDSYLEADALSPDALGLETGELPDPSSLAHPFGDDELETDFDLGDPPLRALKLVVGVPIGAKEHALEVEVEGKGVSRIPFERVEAVAVAAVAGLSDKPVLIVDLVLNWLASPDQPLKVVRFHSNRFDPRRVVPAADSALDALRQLVAGIVEQSGASLLPDGSSLAGSRFARYADSACYEREVLGAEV